MKFTYAIIIVSAYYPNYPIAFTEGMAEAMDIAIQAKRDYEGTNIDHGDNRVIIKRKLY